MDRESQVTCEGNLITHFNAHGYGVLPRNCYPGPCGRRKLVHSNHALQLM